MKVTPEIRSDRHPDFSGAKEISKKHPAYGGSLLLVRETGSNRIIEISRSTHRLKITILTTQVQKNCCSVQTLSKRDNITFELVRSKGNNFTLKYRESFNKLKLTLKELLKNHVNQKTAFKDKTSLAKIDDNQWTEKYYLELICGNLQIRAELSLSGGNDFIFTDNESYAGLIDVLILKEKELEEKGDNYFFLGGERGRLKQYSVKDGVLVKDYGKMKRDKI